MCESLLKTFHTETKALHLRRWSRRTNKGRRGAKSLEIPKFKKWLVITEMNAGGERTHFSYKRTHAHTHTHADKHRRRHPEHPQCARLFLQGKLVVLLSADFKEACMSA